MFVAIPNIGELLLAGLALVLFTPLVFMLASRLVRHLGVQDVTRPSYLKLSPIALVLWAVVLIIFPLNIGGIVGLLLVWLTVYFLIVSKELRNRYFGRAVLISSYVALCSLIGLGLLFSLVYFALKLLAKT